MKINRENLPDRQVSLVIEFESQEIEPALDKTYRKLVQKVNIPGFRPGKAPRRIFESFVGREALVQEAAESLMPDAVHEALHMESLEGAELSDMEIESTEPLKVRVLLDLEPLAELGDYSDLRLERDAVEITDDQVEGLIHDLRSREGTWHDLSEPRPAQLYDRVTVDMETYTIEGPVAEMTGEDITFQLSDRTGPGWPQEIDQNLVGMNVDEEKDFAITFPEKYANEEMRGREATVHVSLKKIEEQDLPELDEEFIGRASNGELQTVEALRERVRNNLQVREESSAQQRLIDSAVAALVERSNIEIPRAALDREVDRAFERFEADLRQRKIRTPQYFSYFGSTEEEWRAQERERALPRLREVLALRAFADREGIAVEEADVEAEIESRIAEVEDASQQELTRELLNSEEQRRQIENRLFERKLTDRLLEIVGGQREAAPITRPEAAASDHDHDHAHNHDHDHGDEEVVVDEAPAGAEDADEDAHNEAAAPAEISGSIPADQQEPSDLELAGGAAEVMGIGQAEQERSTGQGDR